MKTKKFEKKLVLNKKTIAHLGNGELNVAKGGALVTKEGPSCAPCPATNPTCFTVCPTCFTVCPATGDPCLVCAYPH